MSEYRRGDVERLPKRERTRLALLDGAVKVIATKGIAATRITDITDQVGMANGTFYNYFNDKVELVQAVATRVAAELAAGLDARMADQADAVARVVWATSTAIDQAVADAEFGLVLMESIEQLPEMRADVLRFLHKDLQLGVSQGSFDIEVTPFLLDQVMALIVTSIRAQIASGVDPDKTRQTCENLLRLCGLTPTAARRAVAASAPG